jgi:signal transduction histidine kinase
MPPIHAAIQDHAPSQRAMRLGPRAAMISGFCALLVLMAVLSFDSIRALHQLEASSARVRQDYLNRERTLRDIRFSLYESGNLLREYALVPPDPHARETDLAQLHDMRQRTSSSLDACIRSLPAGRKGPFVKLGSELSSYWRVADRIFSPAPPHKGDVPLRGVALAQRATVLTLTGEVSDVNELEFRQAELEISNVFAESRQRLRTVTAFAFGFGLILAASTILYVSRLEHQAQEKYFESLRSQRELQELSKRLVDAQENERRAIARELHDQIGQSLSALLMDAQNLADAPQASGSFRNSLQKIKLLAEDCVNNVRNMALLLRPSMLDDLGLVAALQWQGRELSKRTGLVVDVVDDHFADNLPEEHKTCIYRVVQEALNNCAKHAHATHVHVLIHEDDHHLALSIEDDGIGLDPQRQLGMGFLGMQERVARLGGTLRLDSSPGKGTRLRVELPLSHATQSAGVPS